MSNNFVHIRGVAAIVLAGLAASASAGYFDTSASWQWISPPATTSDVQVYDPTGQIVNHPFTITSTLGATVDPTGTTLTFQGQLRFDVTISAGNINQVYFQAEWNGMWAKDPTYSGTTTFTSVFDGFVQAIGADFDTHYHVIYGPAGSPPLAVNASGLDGIQYNFLQTASTTFNAPMGPGGAGIMSSGNFTIVSLRPANGASFFTPGQTVSFIYDYPITTTATPVPEPATMLAVGVALAGFASRRRPRH